MLIKKILLAMLTTLVLLPPVCTAQDQQTTPPAAPKAGADYRLGALDLVRITVFGSPELTTEARISETGNITCPLIGSVAAAGLSVAELEALLVQRFTTGNFLRQPQVAVLIVEYQSQKVTVLGFVNKPGQYPLRAASTVMDALAEAGGIVAQTASDRATLIHADGTHTPLDLEALFRGDPAHNLRVAGGDRIYVPRAEQFYIYGQVQKPGQYRLERNMTVSRAISTGGGLTTRGTERRATLKRRGPDGKEKQVSARATDLLQPDDVLLIKESLF
jgi:polysaccharide export outer membrane protein